MGAAASLNAMLACWGAACPAMLYVRKTTNNNFPPLSLRCLTSGAAYQAQHPSHQASLSWHLAGLVC
jgi:hypothetical protein